MPEQPDGPEETPQVGRRPSSPGLLFGIAGMWIAVGIFLWVSLSASWKLIPAAVAIGIGLFFLRGAFLTVQRHDERAGED